MDRPILNATDTVDEAEIRDAFQFYVRRDPAEAVIAKMLENQPTVGEMEANIVTRSVEYWRKGPVLATRRRGGWDGSMLVIDPARIVFYPIAKVANTSVKHWAVRLFGHPPIQPAHEVHRALDSGQYKLQARFHSERHLDTIMRDPDWARVAILRDPMDRLISCYWDKFVRNRRVEGVLHHTRPVYRFLGGQKPPTPEQIEKGITFRQFCHYINLSPRHAMDSHWAPQSRYLETYHWDHLFRIDRIEAFERFVLDRCGPEQQNIRLGQQNVAPRHDKRVDAMLADTLPRDLDQYKNLPNEVFVTPDIKDFVRDYFALDYMLLDRAET